MAEQGPSHWVKSLGLFSIIVTDIGAGIAVGYFAWAKFGAPWWVLLLSSFAGLGLAMYRSYLLVKQQEKED